MKQGKRRKITMVDVSIISSHSLRGQMRMPITNRSHDRRPLRVGVGQCREATIAHVCIKIGLHSTEEKTSQVVHKTRPEEDSTGLVKRQRRAVRDTKHLVIQKGRGGFIRHIQGRYGRLRTVSKLLIVSIPRGYSYRY